MESNEILKQWLGAGAINIFGRPFAGKDTQAKKLLDIFGGTMLGGGDILRNSDIPERVAKFLNSGKLVPSDDYVSIVLPYLSKAEFAGRPLILSSLGRWKGEEAGVIKALEQSNHELKAVVYLDIPEEEVRKRWHALERHDDRNDRADDTLEALEIRLNEYRNKTIPVIDEYEQQGYLIRIDGTGPPVSVHRDILQSLSQRANTQLR